MTLLFPTVWSPVSGSFREYQSDVKYSNPLEALSEKKSVRDISQGRYYTPLWGPQILNQEKSETLIYF